MAALPVIVAFSAAVANAQVIPVADLAVEKTAPAESAAGTNVPFAVTVLNNGPDPAVNAVVVDMVPAGTTFVSAVQNSGTAFTCTTPAGGSGSGSISCSCPSLASGTTATFTFVFHIDPSTAAGAFITNVASAASDTFDSNEENSSGSAVTQTPPPPAADMRVSKVGPGGANPNTNVTYTIELSNGGPGAATSVSLDDTIPGDMTVVSVTQTAGPALTCSNGAGGTVTCTATSFPAGATASLTV
ncbi:MAG: large repetitive protein, partial [Myxococcales bacterium]|nr:large repetitive protein [Myxococcales bacterium]